MKILKPGKVEQRKFVCLKCGCEFVTSAADIRTEGGYDGVSCPEHNCGYFMSVARGEPYEEPTPAQTDRERLIWLLKNFQATGLDTSDCEADFLIANGVTFRDAPC